FPRILADFGPFSQPLAQARAPSLLSSRHMDAASAGLTVAALDLKLVQLVRGAMAAADAQGKAGGGAAGCTGVEPRKHIHPTPKFEPRPVHPPEPHFAPRPVHHPEPRFEQHPQPVAPEVTRKHSPVLDPPWKTLPWKTLPKVQPKIKIVLQRPD